MEKYQIVLNKIKIFFVDFEDKICRIDCKEDDEFLFFNSLNISWNYGIRFVVVFKR